jgi:hypothetical protein
MEQRPIYWQLGGTVVQYDQKWMVGRNALAPAAELKVLLWLASQANLRVKTPCLMEGRAQREGRLDRRIYEANSKEVSIEGKSPKLLEPGRPIARGD